MGLWLPQQEEDHAFTGAFNKIPGGDSACAFDHDWTGVSTGTPDAHWSNLRSFTCFWCWGGYKQEEGSLVFQREWY